MGKRVVVIASGETERVALPHLLRHLPPESHEPVRVLVVHGNPRPDSARRLIRGEWFASPPQERPTKFVVLVDADAASEEAATTPFANLREQLPDIQAPVLVAAAKWHLEAWFFGDTVGLRGALGDRSLGRLDDVDPDLIEWPKQRLQNLLGGLYTAPLAAEIASRVEPLRILSRSASFRRFEASVRNGTPSAI